MTRPPLALVTGATGFIGQHLALRLVSIGHPVRLLVRDPNRLHPELQAAADVVIGDLTDAQSLAPAVVSATVIFHCAANVSTWDRRTNYQQANVLGLKNLLTATSSTAAQTPHFVHLSSADVYGFPAEPCSENCMLRPAGFGYGDSKIDGEQILREHASHHDLSFTILRPTNVMGPGSPFVQRIGDELRSGLMLEINRGAADCGFLHVDNLIDVMLWAADADAAKQETFNVCDPDVVTWHQFLRDMRTGIQGRGVILNLPYALAEGAALAIQSPYRLFQVQREPLLHRLIVRIFGRTCGHRSDKITRVGGPPSRVRYGQAMEQCIAWYLQRAAH